MKLYNYTVYKKYDEANLNDILVKCNTVYYGRNVYVTVRKDDTSGFEGLDELPIIQRENDVKHPVTLIITIENTKTGKRHTYITTTITKSSIREKIQTNIRYAYQKYEKKS